MAFSPLAVAQLDEAAFQQCLINLEAQALEREIPSELVSQTVPTLKLQTRVLELDRSQPEFMQTFGQYLGIRVNETRITTGRQKLSEKEAFLAGIKEEYGVTGQYLMAFWGLETNFGGYLGKLPTLDSLATLACDPRRSTFFTNEFLTALELMDREQLQASQMQGSWAGAVGHTQFMPSSYMQYAVDGDGDGAVDLWRSESDALASGAHFLQELGWIPGLRWGREVKLPEGFDYTLAGRSQWEPLAIWADRGVLRADGQPLPVADAEAALLVPAGAPGPVFLVYENFEVIMRWNRSESYALSVGLLADAIAGSSGLQVKPPEGEGLRIADILLIQRALNNQGFDAGPADGIWGPTTRQALSAFEQANGLVADGFPDPETVDVLLGRSSGA